MILLTHTYKKDRQYNSQNKKGKKTNNCRENTTQKTTFHLSERMNWFLRVKRNINGYIGSELFSDSEPTKFCSSPQCYLISGETANTNCIVFGLTWLEGGGENSVRTNDLTALKATIITIIPPMLWARISPWTCHK